MFTVLGATGVIGRHLVQYLRAGGAKVFTPGRSDTSLFGRPLGHVIYAIGITADFRTRPLATVQAHVCVLADILQRADFESLLYLSSTRIYGGATTSNEDAVFSVNPQSSSDLYNLSKLMGESLCLACGHQGVRIARLSNVVGGEDADTDNFIPTLIREARSGNIVLRTALESEKDYIHIDDVVSLLHKIATAGRHRLYNVASGRQTSHAQWLKHLVQMTGCTTEVAANAPVIRFPRIDIARITAEFGFVPRSVFAV